jgi:NADH-quinone oxidoreductase subunit J
MEYLLILFFGILTIVTAIMVILSRNTVHSALWMVGNCLILAVLFLMLHSEFIAILQVIVYAGAIMMFILYAIMMLNLRTTGDDEKLGENLLYCRFSLLGFLFVALLILGASVTSMALKGSMTEPAIMKFGEVQLLANYIFADGLIPFELVSVLLTAAIVGSIYLAKKN